MCQKTSKKHSQKTNYQLLMTKKTKNITQATENSELRKTQKKRGRPKKQDIRVNYLKYLKRNRKRKVVSKKTEFTRFLNQNFKWKIYVTLRSMDSAKKDNYRRSVENFVKVTPEIKHLLYGAEWDKYDPINFHCHFLVELEINYQKQVSVDRIKKQIKEYFSKYNRVHIEEPHRKNDQTGLNRYTTKYYFYGDDPEWDLFRHKDYV